MKRFFEALKGSVGVHLALLIEIAFTKVWERVNHFFPDSLTAFTSIIKELPTVQSSAASTGVVSSSISFPYKHNPASNRKVSRAPKPASLTSSTPSKESATCKIFSDGMEIYN